MPNKPAKPEPRQRNPPREFPSDTLKEALRVPQAIHDKNGGNPMPPLELGPAVGLSPGSTTFRDLVASSLKYGLTAGSWNADRVALSELGKSIVQPLDPSARTRALVEAGLKPPVFKSAYEYYKNKKLPDAPFFENALIREFHVPRELGAECAKNFLDNCEFLGLIRNLSTGRWLSAEVGASAGVATIDESPTAISAVAPAGQSLGSGPAPPMQPPPPPPVKNLVFVGHGSNKRPLEQLESILKQYGIPYKVAVEEPNKGRPISQKVADLMNECGAAILIFTADEELRTVNGDPVWRPSENVVHELGAASVLYGGKIVIFKEESVDFPTNFRDIGHISFPKDDLTSKMHDLFKELIAFKIIKVSVGA